MQRGNIECGRTEGTEKESTMEERERKEHQENVDAK